MPRRRLTTYLYYFDLVMIAALSAIITMVVVS